MSNKKARLLGGLLGKIASERDDNLLGFTPLLRLLLQTKNFLHFRMLYTSFAEKSHFIQFGDEARNNNLVGVGAFQFISFSPNRTGVVLGDGSHLRLSVSEKSCAARSSAMKRFAKFAAICINFDKPHDPLEFDTSTNCTFMLVVVDALECVAFHFVHLLASGFVSSYVSSISQNFDVVNRQNRQSGKLVTVTA